MYVPVVAWMHVRQQCDLSVLITVIAVLTVHVCTGT